MKITRRTPEAQEAYLQGYRAAEAAAMRNVRRLIDEQARDEGLWFQAETCAEAYVQTALRKLHAAVEGDKSVIFPAEHQKTRADNIRLRAALAECAAPFDTGPTTIDGAARMIRLEFERRIDIAGSALEARS